MADAKHALNRDAMLDGDDPFLDASDIERLMLGEPAPGSTLTEPVPAPEPDRGGRRFGAGAPLVEDDFVDTYRSEGPAPQPQGQNTLDAEFAELQDEFMAAQAAMPAGEALFGEIDREIADQPVPRISIAAFCERPETGALVHNAAGDRRLAKAHLTVELGGLPAAIERYHDATTPNLLIVESGMRGQGLFEQLEELAGVCDPDTKVIIIGAANDIALYRELMKRGVSEYLVPPMTPLHLIRSISDLFLDPDQPFAGKTIAFIGAKGGVGSSTVAHNCSWALAEGLHTDAVLVDLDLSFGTAGLDFNQ
ncbi:MAG: pilus assembly protein CpaE, partial [Maricaulis sp.]